MYMHRTKLMLALPLFFVLNGCSTMSGTPKSPLEYSDTSSDSHDTETVINQYSKEFAAKAIQIATDPSKIVIKETERNNLISMALTIMDVRYAEFVNGTETTRKNKEMLTDFVELSMNLAGTAVGAAGTKTILAAISAGVNGINGSIDTNYFYEKTFQSLVAQMNADRKEVLVFITKGMTLPVKDYQWSQAVHDLIEYYNAGTLLGAISSIQQVAGKNEENAETLIKGYKGILMVQQVATPKATIDRTALTLSLNNITNKNLDKVKGILVPLSKELSNLPECNALATKETGNMNEIKRALQLCIQSVSGETTRPFEEDHAEIAKQFKEAGILQ